MCLSVHEDTPGGHTLSTGRLVLPSTLLLVLKKNKDKKGNKSVIWGIPKALYSSPSLPPTLPHVPFSPCRKWGDHKLITEVLLQDQERPLRRAQLPPQGRADRHLLPPRPEMLPKKEINNPRARRERCEV